RKGKRLSGEGTSLSRAAADIVTGPKGDRPEGGLKTPFTTNVLVVPLGNVIRTAEPSCRSCFFAYPSSTKTPSSPSWENTACEPTVQVMLITSAMPGSTAVANSLLPKTLTSPVRTLPIAVTPGAFAA